MQHKLLFPPYLWAENKNISFKFFSEIQSLQSKSEQPIRMKLAKIGELARKSKQRESANESRGKDERKTNKQTIKEIASIIKTQSPQWKASGSQQLRRNERRVDSTGKDATDKKSNLLLN